jgi:hypothetical protein
VFGEVIQTVAVMAVVVVMTFGKIGKSSMMFHHSLQQTFKPRYP